MIHCLVTLPISHNLLALSQWCTLTLPAPAASAHVLLIDHRFPFSLNTSVCFSNGQSMNLLHLIDLWIIIAVSTVLLGENRPLSLSLFSLSLSLFSLSLSLSLSFFLFHSASLSLDHPSFYARQQGCGFVLLIVQPEGINVLRNCILSGCRYSKAGN